MNNWMRSGSERDIVITQRSIQSQNVLQSRSRDCLLSSRKVDVRLLVASIVPSHWTVSHVDPIALVMQVLLLRPIN